MPQYISYDYLYSKRDSFPLVYKLVYLHILDNAPISDSEYSDGYQDGYENGRADAEAEYLK